ncbi:Uncharacterised protein [Serratia grimesii]|nr:Uncharacterised protein [Serratia grimesii]CAI1852224.1 Uncharacterised protein [Serratia grimesii]CAI2420308.1 Uncharacterised protein [Serratia grimesii]SUI34976.1 Uncharacterised protein [Serratia grimesii]
MFILYVCEHGACLIHLGYANVAPAFGRQS